jgi:hypothetical protein
MLIKEKKIHWSEEQRRKDKQGYTHRYTEGFSNIIYYE